MDATLVSAYKDCLIDLWAWDFNLGSGIDNIKLSNGVYDDQLESHGFDEPPKSLVEMEEMVKFIQISERGAENYKVFGYGSGYADDDDMTGFAAELATSTNSIIISKDSNSSIATGDFRNAISMLLGWMNDQVIDPDDFKLTSSEAFEKFKLRQLIFLRSTPKQLLDMEDVPFDWSVTNLPGFNVTNLNGSYTGNLNGHYIGVYKYSKNPAAAVKAVNYFSSKGYQDVLTANKDFGKTYLTNPYRNSFSDESNCELLNELCPVYDNTITSLRPGHCTGTLYPNVSSIIRDGLMAIFDGTKDLNNGIDQMDDQIRILLKMPFRNSTSSIKPPHKPGKKPLKNLAEQALVLIIFVGVGLVAVMLYRQKLIVEKAKEELERLRVMESARLKKEGKQSADGPSNDEKSTLLQ
ncbi:hypothetical protein HDV02_004155 [Globomyces sp. JEL0801]|nr:hypothetical protein HDV02_004155 [Globomyces sp. JEL0801]